MFGMRGSQPQHSDQGYPQHSSCLPTESKMVPSMHPSSMSSSMPSSMSSGQTTSSGSGDQLASTETPPQTPPNGMKLTGSGNAGMNQLTDTSASSYHGLVQPQQPHNPYSSQYSSLHSYEDKTMVPQYTNDSINNIYNVTNNRT